MFSIDAIIYIDVISSQWNSVPTRLQNMVSTKQKHVESESDERNNINSVPQSGSSKHDGILDESKTNALFVQELRYLRLPTNKQVMKQ